MFSGSKKKRTKVKPLAGVWRVSLQCRLHLSKNKMSATSIPARSLGSGQAWLADVTLGSDVISCRSHDVEKGYLAFFWAHAGGGCIGAGCGAPKCCVTCTGSVAGLWQGSLWRGHWHLCCKLGLCPISVQLVAHRGAQGLHPTAVPYAYARQSLFCWATGACPVPAPCLGARYNPTSEH